MTMLEQIASTAMNEDVDPRVRRRAYDALIVRLRERIPNLVPAGARVLVVSRGDDALLRFGTVQAGHYPQAADGRYAGHYPADSEAAVAHLEELRAGGAQYLLFPQTALWWLDHYAGLNLHLQEHYRQLHRDADFALFQLGRAEDATEAIGAAALAREAHWRQIASLLDAILPQEASVTVISGAEVVPGELGGRSVHHISAGEGHPLAFALRDAIRPGIRYLLVAHTQGDPTNGLILSALRARCRVVLHHADLCTVFETIPIAGAKLHQLPGLASVAVSSPERIQPRGPSGEA